MKTAVLFDMDGVLIDSLDAHWHSWEISCRTRNISLTRTTYEQLFGSSFKHFVEILAPDMPDEEREHWYAEKEECYRQLIIDDFPEMPGASALVQRAKDAGFQIGVASSGPRGNVDLLLQKLTAGNLVQASCSSSEVQYGKPKPDVFVTCASMLGVPTCNCIVIEDSIPGLIAAKAAGMPAIALVGTRTRAELQTEATLVVDHLDHITPALLGQLRTAQNRKI